MIKRKEFLGHPVGLYILFFSEAWERFSYYGMRSLLVLYMTSYLIKHAETGGTVVGFGALKTALEGIFGPLAVQPLASQIYGLYTGFVYFTPFFGGIIADRFLGQRKTVVVGGVLMALGHFLMAFETWFFVALLFLIAGNGCFKPNVSTQVGLLYPERDPRRDGAYTIFYMGINVGALLSPLVCGTLGQRYGWHYGFTAAGVGMVLGLCVYLWGQKHLAQDNLSKTKADRIAKEPLTGVEWKAIAALMVLCALNVVFWGVYEQQGNTIQLFADQNTDWHIFGWAMPSTWFQAVNPFFIIAFAPLLDRFWARQAKSGREPDSVVKMSIGCLLLGLSFLPMIYIAHGLGAAEKISFLWLVGCTFFYTMGELYLSPIGLSLVSKVAPARLVSMLMGLWFLSIFFGNYLAGYIGTYYEKMPKEAFFLLLTGMGVAAASAIFAVRRPLKNAIGNKI
jgi:POT family proton-dependent oligopeptide transporter